VFISTIYYVCSLLLSFFLFLFFPFSVEMKQKKKTKKLQNLSFF